MQNQELMQFTSKEEHKLLSDCILPSPVEMHNIQQDLQMNDESVRLSTFSSWPNEDIIASQKLAKAGFFYSKNGDEVQCFSCGGRVKDWQSGDVAIRKHRELFPKCNFIAEIFNKASKKINIGPNTTKLLQNNLLSNEISHNTRITLSNNQTSLHPEENVASTSRINDNVSRNNENITSNPDFEKLKFESERLKTFDAWPLDNPKPEDLANVGFFYLSEEDKVQCVFCHGIVSHWENHDDPLREHSRHFSFCPFIMGRDVGNIPIKSTRISHPFTRGHDECGSSLWKNSIPENGYKFARNANKLENFGVKPHHGPRHPAQASKDARMRSFVTWPSTSVLKPAELVDAGFFYIGIKDYTRCFYCDGGLCNWEKGDDPWVEHAKWFQDCAYIRLNKGDEFVESCQNASPQKPLTNETPMESVSNELVNKLSINIENQVEEYMKSNIVKSAIEPGIFPVHLIKQALIKRIEKDEGNFKNVDQLCEAVLNLQQQMENNSSQEPVMNSYDEPMEVKEEMNVVLRNSTIPSESIPSKINSHVLGQNTNETRSIDDLLKEQRLCKICMDKEIGVLFLPCGHLVACVQCAPAMSDCPFCRKSIKGTVRAFLT